MLVAGSKDNCLTKDLGLWVESPSGVLRDPKVLSDPSPYFRE